MSGSLTKTLKCRRCKGEAEVTVENGRITCITCVRCAVKVEGEEAIRLYKDHAKYLAAKELQKSLRRSFPKSSKDGITISHSTTKLPDPGGPFILD